MSWNHRVVKEVDGSGETFFSIREVFYGVGDDDSTIWGFSGMPRAPLSEDLEGLKQVLKQMLKACDKEILDSDHKLADSGMDIPEEDDDE